MCATASSPTVKEGSFGSIGGTAEAALAHARATDPQPDLTRIPRDLPTTKFSLRNSGAYFSRLGLFIGVLFVEAKQRRLPKYALEKTRESGAPGIVLTVVMQMTFLAQGAQIRMLVVRRIVIEMRGCQNDGAVILGKHPALPV